MECLRLNHPGSWVKEKFREVQKWTMGHEGKIDPNKLYEKTSKAIEILLEILEAVMHCKGTVCTVAAAFTNLNIGMLQVELKHTRLATEYFKKCIDLLGEKKLSPEGILSAISANNQLGQIYVQRGSYREAIDFLKQAEDLYIKFTADKLDPVHMATIIMGSEDIEEDLSAKSILEKLHTSILYNLAVIYRDLDKCNFVLYCHRALSRLLSQDKLMQDLDYVNWAANAAIISQFVLEQNKFPQARHHLAAASCILDKYFEILKAKGTRETSESIAAEYKRYDDQSAGIARCWAMYGIALLGESKKRLSKRVEEDDQDSKPAKVSSEVCKYPQTETMEYPRFVDLEPELVSITNEITDLYLLDFNDARPVFLHVRKWLDKAKEYYTFENHASDYAAIAKNLSQAYKYLAFFENDEDRQARMHKRRIDILEEIIERFSPRYYRIICREIWIELAETYTTILDLKMNRLQTMQANATPVTPMAPMIAKIERLAKNSIKHYQSYLNSLEMNKSKSGIESFSDDLLYSALHSYFRIGKLYNKIVISDIQQGIENTQSSLDAYSFIVNYYDKHPEKQKELEKWDIVELSKEYVTLLPLTLDKFKQQQENQ